MSLHPRTPLLLTLLVLLCFAMLSVAPSEVKAIGGTVRLDDTFGGAALTEVLGVDRNVYNGSLAKDILPLADGSVVVASTLGANMNEGYHDLRLNKFLPDGTLDLAFGTNGEVRAHLLGFEDSRRILQDNNGRLLVGIALSGSAELIRPDFAVARFSATGVLDTSFGTNGLFRHHIANSDYINNMVVLPDNRILIVGGADSDRVIMRLTATGDFDPTFSSDGIIQEPNGVWNDVELLPNGQFMVAGALSSSTGQPTDFAVRRYNADGTLDSSFGTGGTTLVSFGTSARVVGITQTSTGKWMLTGQIKMGPIFEERYDMAAAQLTASGAIDPTFSGDGKATFSFNDFMYVGETLMEGRASVNGSVVVTADSQGMRILRLLPDGTLDNTFGTLAEPTPGFYGLSASPRIYPAPDGGWWVRGGRQAAGVVRLTPNGTPDVEYGAQGYTVVGALRSGAWGMEILADGKIVVASSQPLGVTRLNANGTPDLSFGAAGIARGFGRNAASLARDAQGRFLVGGDNAKDEWAVIRFLADGTPDESFVHDLPINRNESATAILPLADGRMYVAGVGDYNLSNGLGVARLLENGARDTTFNSSGFAFVDRHCPDTLALALDKAFLVQQADGKIVAASSCLNQADRAVVMVRFNSDGSLDTTFGTNGVLTYAGIYQLTALLPVEDGKMVVLGRASYTQLALARFSADGVLDTTFGTNGVTTHTTPTEYVLRVAAATRQSDGRIIVASAGETTTTEWAGDRFLTRFTANGLLDTTFGTNGDADISLGLEGAATNIAFQSTDKLIVAGFTFFQGVYEQSAPYRTVARYDLSGQPGATPTVTATGSMPPVLTPTVTPTGSLPPVLTPTVTPTGSLPPVLTPTVTPTGSLPPVLTPTVTPTGSLPPVLTPTVTPTGSLPPVLTPTVTPTGSLPPVLTPTPTNTSNPPNSLYLPLVRKQ